MTESPTYKLQQLQTYLNNRLSWDESAMSNDSQKISNGQSPVFILCPARSGSTLLRVMLAGSPDLFAPPELELLSFANLKNRKEGLSARLDYMLEGLVQAVMNLKNCSIEKAHLLIQKKESKATPAAVFYERLQQWAAPRRLVDKSVHYSMSPKILERAEQYFENAQYIHLSRHPYATIQSIESLSMQEDLFGFVPNFSDAELAEYTWLICHQNILSFLKNVPKERQHHLQFEDLVTAPEMEMRRLCAFLQIPFHTAMLQPYQAKQQRMTDNATGKEMIGDPNFHKRNKIDAKAANAWKVGFQPPNLSEKSKVLAGQMGYWDTGILPLEWYTKIRKTAVDKTKSFPLNSPQSLKITQLVQTQEKIAIAPSILTALVIYISKVTAAKTITIGVPVDNQTLPVQIEVHETMPIKAVEQQVLEKYRYAQKYKQFTLPHTPENPLYEIAVQKINSSNSQTLENNKNQIETLILYTTEDGQMPLKLELSQSLFFSGMGEWASGHFQKVFEKVLTNPTDSVAQIKLLTEAEKEKLATWNNTKTNYPKDKTTIQFFEEQAAKTPNNIAVFFENKKLTYEKLNEKANQLAHYLRKTYQIQGDDVIALQLERNERMIISMLAVWKAGAAYLPIGTDLPKERVRYMLEDSQAKVLLQDASTYGQLKLDLPIENGQLLNFKSPVNAKPILNVETIQNELLDNLENINQSTDLAYIIYTSGSTGKPKGVMIEHRSLVNYCSFLINFYTLGEKDRVLQFANFTFDMSVEEIFPYLMIGADICLRNNQMIASTANFLAACEKYQLSLLNLPPVFFNGLTQDICDAKLSLSKSMRIISVGGDATNFETINKWVKYFGNRIQLINGYGPTEVTIAGTMGSMTIPELIENQIVSIGYPISNSQIYILDTTHQIVPIGMMGELCIAGDGLARGYLNNEKLTNEKFIAHPFKKGKKIYKTGDLARWLPDGNIEFLGRIDHQLKIRGYRIEAGEIEQVLLKHATVQSAVVTGQKMGIGKELVAYLVAKTDVILPNTSELRAFLSQDLPDYMLPTYFVELDALPLSSSGKINRKALPLPDVTIASNETEYVPSKNPIQEQLVSIWQTVLNQTKIGIQDNFFSLGGHSLKALRIAALIEEHFLIQIPIKELFRHLTIESLAKEIEYINALNNLQVKASSQLRSQFILSLCLIFFQI